MLYNYRDYIMASTDALFRQRRSCRKSLFSSRASMNASRRQTDLAQHRLLHVFICFTNWDLSHRPR